MSFTKTEKNNPINKKTKTMPLEEIKVQPYIVDPRIVSIKIYVEDFYLNRHECWCLVYQYDKEKILIATTRVHVPPEIYLEWGTNDSYIEDWVIDQMGMERKREFYPMLRVQDNYNCVYNDF